MNCRQMEELKEWMIANLIFEQDGCLLVPVTSAEREAAPTEPRENHSTATDLHAAPEPMAIVTIARIAFIDCKEQ